MLTFYFFNLIFIYIFDISFLKDFNSFISEASKFETVKKRYNVEE